MEAQLAGTTVLVTGASGGIGEAIARAFAAEDAEVVLHCHRNLEAAHRLCKELGEGQVVQGDLRDEKAVAAMFEEIASATARLDALVVNAGAWVAEPAPLHEMSLVQWNETLSVDLTSAFLTCRGFLRHLCAVPREEASIVLVGSTAALFGEAGHADYAAAKAGLVQGLGASLKNEIVGCAPLGRVNSVCPGWTATKMAADAIARPGALQRATATMAMEKIARPEDVARAVVFLSSARLAGHVTGAVLPVAGGMEGRLLRDGRGGGA